MKKRILSILTVLALCLGLLPTTVFAVDGDKAIMLGTNGISGYDDSTNSYDYIYFGNWKAPDIYTTNGPIKWRVLDDQTNTGGDGLFLLSDVLFGKGNKYGGGVCFNQDRSSNVWQGSAAQKWCQDFYGSSFSTGEQGAVLATTKTDAAYKATSVRPPIDFLGSELKGDTVFFLSAEEVESSAYGFINNAARLAYFGNTGNWGAWWLRSPDKLTPTVAGTITRSPTSTAGSLSGNFVDNDYSYTARPAFNLDLDAVLFTSAADGGKSASGMDSGLTAVDAYNGSEWKLTLLDSSRNFGVMETDISGDPGDTITLHYTGATTGDNEYISVILAAESGVQYYGRIAKATTAEGEISLTIPDTLAEGTYTLNVFNEQCNGDYKTDYASAFAEVALTVDETAPVLSDGSATRDSETAATVKFTSDEAGSYYYIAQDTEITLTNTEIATQGTKQACKAGENEIELDNITANAWYVAVVAQDAVGNISDVLKISIPAIYTLTVNLNGGSGNTTGGVYPAGEVVNIDAGRRSNYRFTGWTTSNGGTFADASSASTTFTMPAADTTITANWQYDSPYIPPTKPDGPSTGASDGWEDIREEIADADRGDTITIDMNGETEVPGEIFEEVAGKDVTVEFELEDGISWAVNGQDIPTATDFSDLDLGVDMGTSGISVDVINSVTGELGSVQITLAHDGEFGFTLTLTAPLGKENAGYWANLYHYNEVGKTLDFETSAQVASDGTASLRMTHASQYAIVIDDKSHALPFADLGENQWYEAAVRYAYTHDIMQGTSPTTFVPNTSLTRAEAVQVLYNLEGQPTVSGNAAFPDLVEKWYKPAIAWAEQTGVVDGYEDGTFRPGQPVNRMEFAQMLYNYAKYKGYDLTAEGDLSQFPDGDSVQPWAETAMSWANGNALINGHDDGTLEPGGTTTRAQAASILMRFDQNVVEN